MTFSSPEVEERVRQGFRKLNRGMLWMFRLGLQRWFQAWPRVTGRVLVLTHTGRRSGTRYHTPLNFAPVDGDLYLTAGFGPCTDWYRNVLADPRVEVWLPDGWWTATAEDVSDHPDRRRLLREVLVGSGFAAYLFGVRPTLPDDRLDALTGDYRLIRITLAAARTGPGGPGDLSWVWPLAAAVLWVARRRRARA